MTFLPIVERELRVASRRRSTFFGRLAGALIAMVVGGWLMIAMNNEPPNEMGKVLFVLLSAMLFTYSLAAGARITADCVSEEKREGTLGLLFLTDLKGYDIVMGKLAANSVNTFYGLLAAFPVLAISLLMGGVSSEEFWKVALVATNLLFFSLAAGMFASAVCRDERKALSLAFLIVIVLLIATPAVEFGLNIVDHNRAMSTVWLIPSPGFACFAAFGSQIGLKPADFWTSVLLTHAYGWTFFALASAIIPSAWQDKTASRKIPFRAFWRRVFKIDRATETARRTRLMEINPFLWLAARDSLKTVMVWTTLLSLSALWIWAAVKWPHDWITPASYVFAAVLFHTVLKFWIAAEACFRFVEDRKSGALELLLSTPLSIDEILNGQRRALIRQFGGPVVYVLAVDFLFLLLGLNSREINYPKEHTFWVLLWVLGTSIFVMDLFALGWLGMWLGVSSKQANRAANGAIGRILVIPWLAFLFLMTFFGVASIFAKLHMDEESILIFWFILAVANNLIFMTWAKGNLRERFREMATQRFAPKKSRFAALKIFSDNPADKLPPVIH